MSLPHETEPDNIYVFATKGGVPTNPDWYYNLTAAGNGSVERGTETYKVSVHELTGAERDRIYAEQARRYPGFAEYESQTAGVRVIPVLELPRASLKTACRRPGHCSALLIHNAGILRLHAPRRRDGRRTRMLAGQSDDDR